MPRLLVYPQTGSTDVNDFIYKTTRPYIPVTRRRGHTFVVNGGTRCAFGTRLPAIMDMGDGLAKTLVKPPSVQNDLALWVCYFLPT
jgi:hypothetical protein